MPKENRSSNTELATQHPQGRRERFQKWVIATKHPILGYLDGTWLARGDDREGYADKYVQGLWVAFKEFAQPAPQPHAEPIAWMVGTAIWWTKEEAERDAAEAGLPVVGLGPMTESSSPAVSIPDGYCLMPRRLTAENGAKALLLGEFKLEVTRECPECRELEEPAEGCEICDGEGEYGQSHIIPWEKIKFIYSEAVKGLALQSNTAR